MAGSHTKAVNKYNSANYDSLRIVVPKGQKDKIKAHAEKRGESINGFVGRESAKQCSVTLWSCPAQARQTRTRKASGRRFWKSCKA